jgi:hypothetical protein
MADAVLHEGRVRRSSGAAVPGAIVFVASGTAPTPERAIICDADGRFRIALPPGRFEIKAQARDGAQGQVNVETDTIAQSIEIIVGEGQ